MSDSFEWYYFDVHTDHGHDVVFTLHVKPFMSRFEISIFDFFVYKNNKRLIHHFFSRPQRELQRGQDNRILNYDDRNFLKKTDDTFVLQFTDESITFRLKLESLLPTDTPLEVPLLPGGKGNDSFMWIVYAPVCKASGSLVFKNEEIRLDGRGYHDYNGGSVNLKKTLKDWYWGKFFEVERLTILGQIVDRRGKQKNIIVTADENEIHLEQDINIKRASGVTTTGNFSFTETAHWMLDDIRFFVSGSGAGGKQIFSKMMELLLYLLSRIPGLSFLHRLLSNTRYRRFRVEGKRENGEPLVSFFEEIEF